MKILLLPDSFKGSLSAHRAASILEEAARKVFPDAEIVSWPVADGGEGTLAVVQKAAGGALLPQRQTHHTLVALAADVGNDS